jgi:phospholipid/cholesterol/gamma-HCH transport system substrate-binding protein
MSPQTRTGRAAYSYVAMACAVVLLLVAGALFLLGDSTGTRLVAYFDRAVGLYADSSVRVLGVRVGRITDVQPQGEAVRVEMQVDDGVSVPANVGAVVVAPSLVSDRYVQLTPAYDGGPEARSGMVIPRQRTETPIELDDLFQNLDDLAVTLGPKGANSDGALSKALDTIADNLKGNGQTLNDTVTELSKLATTFDTSKGDLFDTVQYLGDFTDMLARSDKQVNELFERVADVTDFLADESGEVDSALSTLAVALSDVQGFVDDNDEVLKSNVDKLTQVTKVLVDRRGELAEVLDVGPTGLNNFINAYDAASGTIAVRGALQDFTYPPVMLVCRLIAGGTPAEVPKTVAETCKKLAPFLDGTIPLPTLAEVMESLGKGGPPPLPLELLGAIESSSGGGS